MQLVAWCRVTGLTREHSKWWNGPAWECQPEQDKEGVHTGGTACTGFQSLNRVKRACGYGYCPALGAGAQIGVLETFMSVGYRR